MPTLVEELAARHLGGPLPADFIAIMAPLDDAGEETEAFLRRMSDSWNAHGSDRRTGRCWPLAAVVQPRRSHS